MYKMDLTKTAKISIENTPLSTAKLLPYIRAYKIYKYTIYNKTPLVTMTLQL
jgi:hypothetical protein